MNCESSRQIWDTIRHTTCTDRYLDLLQSAARYARLRVDWKLETEAGEKARIDAERTRAHDAFIADCNVLRRAMEQAGEETLWRSTLTNDRREIGDFACWLHAIMGIEAR